MGGCNWGTLVNIWYQNHFFVLWVRAFRIFGPRCRNVIGCREKRLNSSQKRKFSYIEQFSEYGGMEIFAKARLRHLFLSLNLHQMQTLGPTLIYNCTQIYQRILLFLNFTQIYADKYIYQRILWFSAAQLPCSFILTLYNCLISVWPQGEFWRS